MFAYLCLLIDVLFQSWPSVVPSMCVIRLVRVRGLVIIFRNSRTCWILWLREGVVVSSNFWWRQWQFSSLVGFLPTPYLLRRVRGLAINFRNSRTCWILWLREGLISSTFRWRQRQFNSLLCFLSTRCWLRRNPLLIRRHLEVAKCNIVIYKQFPRRTWLLPVQLLFVHKCFMRYDVEEVFVQMIDSIVNS